MAHVGFSGCRVVGPTHNIPVCPYCEVERLREKLALETKRLDYIENHFHVLGFTRGDTWFKIQSYDTKPKRYGNMREAIDDVLEATR